MPGSVGEALALSRQEAGELSPHINATRLDKGGVEITSSAAELNKLDGVTATPAELNKVDGKTGGLVEAIEVTFTEDGGTTFTGDIVVPAGATIIDIIVQAVALWDDGTSASMIVGDVADPNGFYDAVDLKATDLILAETLRLGNSGGVEGAYSAGTLTHWKGLYNAAARTITGVITTGAQDGTAGRTRMTVVFVLPVSSAAGSA